MPEGKRKEHEPTTGRVLADTEGVDMTDTGRQSAKSADLAWCGSPLLSVPSAVSSQPSPTSMSSAPQRPNGPADPASPYAGWHLSRQGSGCRRAAVPFGTFPSTTSSSWSCCVLFRRVSGCPLLPSNPLFQPLS